MCNATIRKLGEKGIEFTKYMLEDMPDKVEEFKAQGYMQAPIVVTENDMWSGYRPDKIEGLKSDEGIH